MEHNFVAETRTRTANSQGHEVVYRQSRWVCTCGFFTPWSGDGVRARRAKGRHNLEGQLEHDASPPWPGRAAVGRRPSASTVRR